MAQVQTHHPHHIQEFRRRRYMKRRFDLDTTRLLTYCFVTEPGPRRQSSELASKSLPTFVSTSIGNEHANLRSIIPSIFFLRQRFLRRHDEIVPMSSTCCWIWAYQLRLRMTRNSVHCTSLHLTTQSK